MNRPRAVIRVVIETPQRREVRRRGRAFRRCFAFRSSLTFTLPSRLKKPKPSRPRRVAGATPLFSRFTLSLSRCSAKAVTPSSTRWAARSDAT